MQQLATRLAIRPPAAAAPRIETFGRIARRYPSPRRASTAAAIPLAMPQAVLGWPRRLARLIGVAR